MSFGKSKLLVRLASLASEYLIRHPEDIWEDTDIGIRGDEPRMYIIDEAAEVISPRERYMREIDRRDRQAEASRREYRQERMKARRERARRKAGPQGPIYPKSRQHKRSMLREAKKQLKKISNGYGSKTQYPYY